MSISRDRIAEPASKRMRAEALRATRRHSSDEGSEERVHVLRPSASDSRGRSCPEISAEKNHKGRNESKTIKQQKIRHRRDMIVNKKKEKKE